MNKAMTWIVLSACGALLAAHGANAGDKPSAAEIAKARSECALQKQRVRKMENSNEDAQKVEAARLDWEHACVKAQALIRAATGEPEPVVVPRPAEETAAPTPAATSPGPAPAPATADPGATTPASDASPAPVLPGPALPQD